MLAALAALGFGAQARRHSGVLEVHWPSQIAGLPCGAITLGHVVLASSAAQQNALRAHERVHVRQAECWGPLFLPAYVLASAWAGLCGGHLHRDNFFERQARRVAGF